MKKIVMFLVVLVISLTVFGEEIRHTISLSENEKGLVKFFSVNSIQGIISR